MGEITQADREAAEEDARNDRLNILLDELVAIFEDENNCVCKNKLRVKERLLEVIEKSDVK